MKSSILILQCAAIVLVLAACGCGCTDTGSNGPAPTPAPTVSPAPPHVMELSGTTWHLISYRNESGAGQPVIEGTAITAVFNETLGEVGGSAGCNHYTALYTADGNALQISRLAWTEMYCNEPAGVMRQETEYLLALESAATFDFAACQLSLNDDEGEVVLVFEASEPGGSVADLTGTAWHLVSLARGPGEVQSVLEGTRITAVYGDDGSLGGSAGCNRYATNFTQDNDALTIGPITSTMMYCGEPVGVMDQEAAYLTALESASTASQEGEQLVLRNAAGETILVYAEGE
jgi:heat shock protein HslJ